MPHIDPAHVAQAAFGDVSQTAWRRQSGAPIAVTEAVRYDLCVVPPFEREPEISPTPALSHLPKKMGSPASERAPSEGRNSRPLDLVGTVISIAFLAFLVVDALGGEPAAGITFLAITVTAVILLPAVAEARDRSRRTRDLEIRQAAALAADEAIRRLRGQGYG